MDEIWERAVETALEGQTDESSARTLTLDGAVKCIQGRLPSPSLLEKFKNLQLLSIANVGVSSLDQFPKLRNLQKLNLSDNRIAGGLESLVGSGLDSLRDLDLSNNRIQCIEDLSPLAELKLVSLDLYECPVTRVKDYRARVFGLIKSLKYLDKIDAEGNERPESDDEEEEDEEEDEDDPGSGEVDGEERFNGRIENNGHSERFEGIVDVDEDEESDADEEETESGRRFVQAEPSQNGLGEDDADADEEEDLNLSGEEIDEDDGDGDDAVEVHEVEDDSSDDDGIEDDDEEVDDEDELDEDDGDEFEEEVDNDDADVNEAGSSGRLVRTEGEIDGHEQGEDEIDDDDGDFEDEEEDDDSDEGYLVQRVDRAEVLDIDGSGMEQVDEEDEPEGKEDEGLMSSKQKRKRDDEEEEESESGSNSKKQR